MVSKLSASGFGSPYHLSPTQQMRFPRLLTITRFCIDINSPRTLQTVTEKLFQAVSQYAKDVPIIVVATKKDEFLDVCCNPIMKR